MANARILSDSVARSPPLCLFLIECTNIYIMHSIYVHHMQSAILIYIVNKIVARDRHPWYIYYIYCCTRRNEKEELAHITYEIKMKYEVNEK